jgi:phage-related baseplate assembly protein
LRIQLRIAALAGQGTREHYELVAMTASSNVRAASAIQRRPGYVHVVLWLHAVDAQTTLAVAAALNADNARMLGVEVTVGTAQPHPVNVQARIWRTANASPDLLQKLQQRLITAFAERAALGRSVARSWITTLLHADGVAAVDYVGNDAPPATTTLFNDEFPTLGTVQLIDAGVM